jgi:hypothetical protein
MRALRASLGFLFGVGLYVIVGDIYKALIVAAFACLTFIILRATE